MLPHFLEKTDFIEPGSRAADLARLATVLGFVGMLRPHTFAQLRPASFTFVLWDEQLLTTQTTSSSFRTLALQFPAMRNVLGFYITFRSKTMASARAYFPNLSSSPGPLNPMCPLALLLSAAKRNWVKAEFLKKAGRGDTLGKYLQLLTTCEDPISPYALRIGGRTWYVSHGLDRQFCDYL